MLRHEARAFPLVSLDDSQLAAVIEIAELLNAACASLPPERAEAGGISAPPLWLDRARESRIIFLDGERGTGKSSVLASLVRAYFKRGSDPDETRQHTSERQRRLETASKALTDLWPKLQWLEPLDMEPLAGPCNLLVAVLSRIESHMERIGLDPPDWRPGAALDPGYLAELDQLSNDAGLAWDGNVAARAAGVDPDTFASEVKRAERARLLLSRRLSQVTEGLADAIKNRIAGEPLFVLPVDDVDLNPIRVIELLRLLRMAYAPRLMALVLGNYKATDQILALRHSGELGALVREVRFDKALAASPVEVAVLARSITANAIRKLIPPGQRVPLGPMTVAEAMRFSPSGAALGGRAETSTRFGRSLADILHEIPFRFRAMSKHAGAHPPGGATATLGDFLLGPSEGGSGEIRYTGAGILSAPPRHVADMWAEFDRISARAAGAADGGRGSLDVQRMIADFAAKTFLGAAEEDDNLTASDIDSVKSSLDKRAAGVWSFDPGRYEWARRQGGGYSLRKGNFRYSFTNFSGHWAAVRSLEPDSGRRLGPRSVAALCLCHDVIRLGDDAGYFTSDGDGAPGPDVGLVRAVNSSLDLSTREAVGGAGWWGLGWRSFWEFDAFIREWDLIRASLTPLAKARGDDAVDGWLAASLYAWLGAGVAYAGGSASTDPDTQKPGTGDADWQALRSRIVRLCDPKGELRSDEERWRFWLAHLLLTISPESAPAAAVSEVLSDDVRKAISSAIENDPDAAVTVRRLRATRLARGYWALFLDPTREKVKKLTLDDHHPFSALQENLELNPGEVEWNAAINIIQRMQPPEVRPAARGRRDRDAGE